VRLRVAAAAIGGAALLLGAGVVTGREPQPVHVGYRSQVFVVDRDGGVRRITGPPRDHYEPVWSHDGRRIAMSAGGIEVRALSGSVKHRLGHSGSRVAWSRDGRRLAYVRFSEVAADRYVGKLFVSDLDGHERTIVPHGATDAFDWSRDGRTIYYLRGGQGQPEGIWAVSSAGGKPHRVVQNVCCTARVLVSPGGGHILFERRGLWVARADGSGQRQLIDDRYLYAGYGWLADGRVFGGLRRDGHPVVATLSGRRRALGAKMRTRHFAVSPDGRRVAWASERYRSRRALVISARADGSDVRVLAHFTSKPPFTEIDDLAWSPDGEHLVVVPHRHIGD
jgi:Tol biopolymer transport system component